MLFLFSAMYGWLGLQPTVNRPILYLGMFGKGGGFSVGVVLWLSGATDLATGTSDSTLVNKASQ
jgi:hypothetical protein